MVYSEARRLLFLSLSQRLTALYALERESNLGSTFAVLIELSQERDVGSGPVSRVWNFAPNCLPLDKPLQRVGARGTYENVLAYANWPAIGCPRKRNGSSRLAEDLRASPMSGVTTFVQTANGWPIHSRVTSRTRTMAKTGIGDRSSWQVSAKWIWPFDMAGNV
jgi:hypothetical protein